MSDRLSNLVLELQIEIVRQAYNLWMDLPPPYNVNLGVLKSLVYQVSHRVVTFLMNGIEYAVEEGIETFLQRHAGK